MMTSKHLTEAERKTLNEAMAIINKRTAHRSSAHIYFSHYSCERAPSHDLTFWTPAGKQHSLTRGDTFADKIEAYISACNREAYNETIAKEERAKQLRKELAELEGGAA
ncbi:hypothetical protein [Sphingobium sp. HDIP04]|uniref:hypothetical protein n=1 Tax=Sphingobium sp. HDIP04 TaxID=428994 RepID=UPI0003876F86|nr:hypothetical protein [Sphingobium sp. HDIP04]EQB03883.1 hypothetical protein L286_10995 [Sphingobium sp. HDIP04]